jgi:demethylspheroidene O-methyltransferase
VARARAGALFDLCAGFVYSQVLLACVRLRVFDMLRDGPRSAAELAARMDLPPEAARRLLDAAAALRLLDRRGAGLYGLGALGAAMPGNAGVVAMVEHHAMLYRDLADPVAMLRGGPGGGELQRYWAYARSGDPAALPGEDVASYSVLMAASQAMVAEEVIGAYPAIERHRCLLDVGGGEGAFLSAVAAHAPGLKLMLFDLPAVADRAARRLGPRLSAHGGDFFRDPLPPGADIVSLVRVVHDHDDAAALHLLRAVRAALPPGGTLLLAEPMAETRGAEAMGAAYFGMYLFAMGSGRPRSLAELGGMLREAGFAPPRLMRTRTPLLAQVLVTRTGA